jgi:hypothetical protein
MKQAILIAFIILIHGQAPGQSVGYQGKKFIVQAGYAPANNLLSVLLDYNLADEYYSNDIENPGALDPLIIRHVPKMEIEYVVFRYGSVFFRLNSFRHISNIYYFDESTGIQDDLVGIQTKGLMTSLGYRKYTSGNIAPLGAYYGIYGTIYRFTTAFSDSKFAESATPEPFLEYPEQENSMAGLFVQFGTKRIYWDRVVFDFQIDGGWFFKDAYSGNPINNPDQFSPYTLSISSESGIEYYSIFNTKPFFLLTPSVNLGLLVF